MATIYTKQSLIEKLKKIREIGWVPANRSGNAGSVGNTLENMLGITENNLPIPNAAGWELKTARSGSNSLTTLFHTGPSPTALKFVSEILLPKYGRAHKEAGAKYPKTEKSFRQTISCVARTNRGFGIDIDKKERKILISFDAAAVSAKHADWLASVPKDELKPQPCWGFDDLYHKAGTKLYNCFYVMADAKIESGREYFQYNKIMRLSGFSLKKFIATIESGDILIDFDARTGHNHGTKFRFRSGKLPELYDDIEEI